MFKKTAVLFGPILGNGLIGGRDIAGAPIFVMPGPYAAGADVETRLEELRRLMEQTHTVEAGPPTSGTA